MRILELLFQIPEDVNANPIVADQGIAEPENKSFWFMCH